MAAATASSVKILVCGDLYGSLDKAFKRAAKINKAHGPFEALLCVGTTLSNPETGASDLQNYIDGKKKAPLPTYFIAGNEHKSVSGSLDKLPTGGEIAPNLHYLGRSGIKEVSGLSIGYLSGIHSEMYYRNRTPPSVREAAYQAHFEEGDVEHLVKEAAQGGVDILLTCEWGRGYYKLYNPTQLPPVKSQPPTKAGSPVVSELAIATAPRYHFAATEHCFHKLRPYRNADVAHVTRFIGMGNVGNPDKKQKYIYALNAKPLAKMTTEEKGSMPEDSTLCPYDYQPVKRPSAPSTEEAPLKKIKLERVDLTSLDKQRFSGDYGGAAQAWRWQPQNRGGGRGRRGGGRGGRGRGGGRGGRGRNQQPQMPRRMDCWFCLASPKTEEHLIVSVGVQSYVALAKGPLVPSHLLICPIEHVATSASSTKDLMEEMELFQSALQKYYESEGNETLLWERTLPTKGVSHMHYQLLPVAPRFVADAERNLLGEAKRLGLEFKQMEKGATVKEVLGNMPFIRFKFGRDALSYIAEVDPQADMRPLFPLVRRAVANAIGQGHRANWKRCLTDRKDEARMVEAVKSKFAKFEPQFDDDDDD